LLRVYKKIHTFDERSALVSTSLWRG